MGTEEGQLNKDWKWQGNRSGREKRRGAEGAIQQGHKEKSRPTGTNWKKGNRSSPSNNGEKDQRRSGIILKYCNTNILLYFADKIRSLFLLLLMNASFLFLQHHRKMPPYPCHSMGLRGARAHPLQPLLYRFTMNPYGTALIKEKNEHLACCFPDRNEDPSKKVESSRSNSSFSETEIITSECVISGFQWNSYCFLCERHCTQRHKAHRACPQETQSKTHQEERWEGMGTRAQMEEQPGKQKEHSSLWAEKKRRLGEDRGGSCGPTGEGRGYRNSNNNFIIVWQQVQNFTISNQRSQKWKWGASMKESLGLIKFGSWQYWLAFC